MVAFIFWKLRLEGLFFLQALNISRSWLKQKKPDCVNLGNNLPKIKFINFYLRYLVMRMIMLMSLR